MYITLLDQLLPSDKIAYASVLYIEGGTPKVHITDYTSGFKT